MAVIDMGETVEEELGYLKQADNLLNKICEEFSHHPHWATKEQVFDRVSRLLEEEWTP